MNPRITIIIVSILSFLTLYTLYTSDSTPVFSSQQCYIGGCSGQLCTDSSNIISTCEFRDEDVCYKDAICERQQNGSCGWTRTLALIECLQFPASRSPDKPCFVGGCSGQLCSDSPEAISTCEWTDSYACYGSATCARQANGQCGWTSTPELEKCLQDPSETIERLKRPLPDPLPGPDYCYITGCSGQVCSSQKDEMASTCEWKEEYSCYQLGTCERQSDGECGWTKTQELEDCLLKNTSSEPEAKVGKDGQCFVGGCSNQLCTDNPGVISTCEWTEAYACYKTATCERQGDGGCAWTKTPELEQCLRDSTAGNTANAANGNV